MAFSLRAAWAKLDFPSSLPTSAGEPGELSHDTLAALSAWFCVESSAPPSAERPIVAGATRASTTSRTSAWSQIARVPTKGCSETTTSISALSFGTPLTRTSNRGARHRAPLPARPLATSPAAMPATVPSRKVGKTLLVPVEIGTRGTVPHPLATTRLVPSPPSVMIQPAPISANN